MNWQQVFIQTRKEYADVLSDELMLQGAVSITYLDSGDQPIFEPAPGEMPLWEEVTLLALFEEAFDLAPVILFCKTHTAISQFKTELLKDEVWERVWMKDFHPLYFGGDLWIVPSWCDAPSPTAVNLLLDPGLAFGTGTHPTTALCLEYLAQHPPQQLSVLDMGCGSGVLAIAALKLGAHKAYAIDNDPQALLATLENARKNAIDPVSLVISLAQEPLDVKVDCVLANILAQPLIQLAPRLLGYAKKTLILSGILEDQALSVMAAYACVQFEPVIVREGWCLLIGHITS